MDTGSSLFGGLGKIGFVFVFIVQIKGENATLLLSGIIDLAFVCFWWPHEMLLRSCAMLKP